GLFVTADDVPETAELLVVLDSSSIDRLGKLVDRAAATPAAGGHVLVIDHHARNTQFGTLHGIDDHAQPAATLALKLVHRRGAQLTEPAARAIYAGLMTDTSSFRRATPATHEAAARLLATGVNPDEVARPLFDSHPFGWLRMLGAVLGRVELDRAAAQGMGLV